MAWQNGKYIPEEAIGQQYKFADNLQNQKWSPTWAGVLAAGLGGLGSGIHRNSAQSALTSNQDMRTNTLRSASEAPDNASMSKILLDSGVPGYGEKGMDLIAGERQRATERAADAEQRRLDREASFNQQKQLFEFQKRLTMDLEAQKRAQNLELINQILGPGAMGGSTPQPPSGGDIGAAPSVPSVDPNSSDSAFVDALTEAPPKQGVEANKRAAIALAMGETGPFFKALEDKAKPTEQQTKDASFAERMLRAEMDLRQVSPINEKGEFTKYNPSRAANAYAPDSPSWSNLWSANLINSKEWQQYQRAAREGIAAILRKDTGAAVTDAEWEWYFPMYYPQPGDSPQVTLDKQRARIAVAKGLRGGSGPAFDRMFPNFNEQLRARLQSQGANLSLVSPPPGGQQGTAPNTSFDSEADIPEGATVRDDQGRLLTKINGKLVDRNEELRTKALRARSSLGQQ
jgi:hypothetical protein